MQAALSGYGVVRPGDFALRHPQRVPQSWAVPAIDSRSDERQRVEIARVHSLALVATAEIYLWDTTLTLVRSTGPDDQRRHQSGTR
jgi:hypothetical protein